MKTLKFAIIGVGRIGKMHAANISQNSKSEIECIYDINYKFKYPAQIFSGGLKPNLWLERLYLLTTEYLRQHREGKKIITVWSSPGSELTDSNLWDTWFNIMTLSLIDTILYGESSFNFHKSIGIGFFS